MKKNKLIISAFCVAMAMQSNAQEYVDSVAADKPVKYSKMVQIGYQKAQTLEETTASTSIIYNEEFNKRSAKNIGNSLFGYGTGLTVLQNSGTYADYNPTLLVRGLKTLSGTKTLILVDGIERDINDITPEEVESVSILKDAAAVALYGYKGIDGVINITTKRGKYDSREIKFVYEHGMGWQVRKPKFVDSYTYANAMNEALTNDGLAVRYSPDELNAFKTGNYPFLYPNVDWMGETFRNMDATNIYNISFRGGAKKFRYYAMANLTTNKGFIANPYMNDGYSTQDQYSRANLRTNLDIDLSDNTKLKLNVLGVLSETRAPGADGEAGADLWDMIYTLPSAAYPARLENGTWGGSAIWAGTKNPVAVSQAAAYTKFHERTLFADMTLEQDLSAITPGLGASALLSYDNYAQYWEDHSKTFVYGSNSVTAWENGVPSATSYYTDVEEEDAEEDLESRAPIVTVMGHVDHGKTSLLDYIRKANVIAGEAGGITQHIGAYHVTLEDGRKITFLDTPGHEAFTAMRARGAKVTDIAIIIVAADDNVMPQTKEAINHAMAAGVPIVFAINKIDKPTANPDKIKEELANMNFLVEEWGGKYQSQDISAKKGIGVPELMEKVLLEAEMLELKANPNRKATGSIIESSLDKGRGYVATVLVSNGTLKVGDIVLAGTNYGKVKAMFNERNQRMTQAGPSEPALILGLNGAPAAGDTFHVIETEQEAREIANKREQLQREQGLRTQKMLTLDEVGRRLALGDFHELNVIVKGDVDGSVEALSDSLIKLSTEQIQVNVIHKGVGQISESDVSLAAASDAIIVGFQVRPSGAAAKLAEQEGVDIRKYSVIYDAIEEVKSAMEGMLAPTLKEQVTATIEVREVFNISKVGVVAGAMVKTGKVKRTDKARLIRDGIVVFTGNINALKRFKDDVKEVGTNFECGISLTGCNDIKVGDVIETFEEVEVKQTL